MLFVARRMLLQLQADKPWLLHLRNLFHSISPATLCHQGPCCSPFCTFRSFFPLISSAPPMQSIPFFLLLLQTFHAAASQLPLFFSPVATISQLPAVPWAAPHCHSLMRLWLYSPTVLLSAWTDSLFPPVTDCSICCRALLISGYRQCTFPLP